MNTGVRGWGAWCGDGESVNIGVSSVGGSGRQQSRVSRSCNAGCRNSSTISAYSLAHPTSFTPTPCPLAPPPSTLLTPRLPFHPPCPAAVLSAGCDAGGSPASGRPPGHRVPLYLLRDVEHRGNPGAEARDAGETGGKRYCALGRRRGHTVQEWGVRNLPWHQCLILYLAAKFWKTPVV